MKDLFNQKIYCEDCNIQTSKKYLVKEGFQLRALECPTCKDVTLHPGDLKDYQDYQKLQGRDFNVKLRMVGNSFCVSIPKELIDFHKEFEKEFNNLVRLHLEGPGKISMFFSTTNYYKPNNKQR